MQAKKLIIHFIFHFFILNIANAIELKITGPCSEQPAYQLNVNIQVPSNLGQISIEIFDLNKIPYLGTATGMNSLLNTPIGLDSLEVVSDEILRAYGWCYSINSQTPDVMPDQVIVQAQNDVIHWYYAYSTSIRNQWIDYCIPAYKTKSPQFCGPAFNESLFKSKIIKSN